jgi:hypothetical protein
MAGSTICNGGHDEQLAVCLASELRLGLSFTYVARICDSVFNTVHILTSNRGFRVRSRPRVRLRLIVFLASVRPFRWWFYK